MYTIKYEWLEDNDSNGILIPIVEKVEKSDAYSSEISIDEESNAIWIENSFYLESLKDNNEYIEFEEWLKEHFGSNYPSVQGFIRRAIRNSHS